MIVAKEGLALDKEETLEARVKQLEAALREIADARNWAGVDGCKFVAREALAGTTPPTITDCKTPHIIHEQLEVNDLRSQSSMARDRHLPTPVPTEIYSFISTVPVSPDNDGLRGRMEALATIWRTAPGYCVARHRCADELNAEMEEALRETEKPS